MDIYWIQDKQRRGPSTVPDVISLLQTGELTPDTPGWHKGCSAWVPLRELPALADFINKPEPETASEPTAPAEPESAPLPPPPARKMDSSTPADRVMEEVAPQRTYLPSPVARLLARLVDCTLYAVLYGAIVFLQGLPYNASLILSVNPLLWLPMLFLEAWMLSTWGTTPGKALMGIRLTTFGDVTRLSYLRALLRTTMAFTLGLGLMMPQLLPLMLALEYWMLRRRGITPWDARSSTLPTQQNPPMPSRYVLAVISLYVGSVVFFSCMKPWMPGMIDDIARTQPELAERLRQFMPPNTAQPTEKAAPQAPAAPAPQTGSLPGM